MAAELEQWVLVSDASRSSLLVARGVARSELPSVRAEGGPAGMLEVLHRELGLRGTYLRPAIVLHDADGNATGVLRELDAAPPDWAPPAGHTWLELAAAEPEELAPAELRPHVARWLAEQRGAPIPELRSPWARPGWVAAASRWIEQRMIALGEELRGEVQLVAQWPLSSVLRLETASGRVFFKAVFEGFRHEPALTAALSRELPALVPDVLAVDVERGWILMRELTGQEMAEQDVGVWARGLEVACTVQRAWIGRGDELRTLGAHDRALGSLEALLADLPSSVEDVAERRRLERALPTLGRLLSDVAGGALPETLVHGDLHPWNVMVAGGRARIFDWSDASISHPLFDLPTYLLHADSDAARAKLLDAYLAGWSDLASTAELRTLYAAAAPLACLHQAISYLGILDNLEEADRWWFSGEPGRWLGRAVELVEAMA